MIFEFSVDHGHGVATRDRIHILYSVVTDHSSGLTHVIPVHASNGHSTQHQGHKHTKLRNAKVLVIVTRCFSGFTFSGFMSLVSP